MENDKNDKDDQIKSVKSIQSSSDVSSHKPEKKKHAELENTINDMLDKVMDEKESNNNSNIINPLKLMDDDENEEEQLQQSPARKITGHKNTLQPGSSNNSKQEQQFNLPHFERGNKRNQTANFYPVNMPLIDPNNYFNVNQRGGGANFQNMNIKQNDFNIHRNNNINNMNNLNNVNNINNGAYGYLLYNNGNTNLNMQQTNNTSQNSSTTNSTSARQNSIGQMNVPPTHFMRNNLPISKTVVYHHPLQLLNPNFNNINNLNNSNNLNMLYNQNCNPLLYYNNNNLINGLNNNNHNKQNFVYNNINNMNNNINVNNSSNNSNSDSLDLNHYKRNEWRKKTYDPNYLMNPMINNLNKGINNFQIQGINQNIIANNPNFNLCLNPNINCNISTEALLFELKIILEKTGKIDHYIYGLIKGKFLDIIKNHKGSKIFQKYLKMTHCDIMHQIFLELSFNLEDLITDSYANYFCKKFFTYLNQKDRIDFLKGIEKSLVKLSCDSIGTYPIQTIIEHVGSKNEKIIIINALKDHVEELAFDPFGSHVLEKLLTCFEEEYVTFIYLYVSDNFFDLANNNNGICVVKKILTFTHKKALHDKIKQIIKENALQLILHPYANFVIQVVVECWPDYKDILKLYEKKYYNLSLEKYASNVVERCIEKDPETLNDYINEIVNSNHICDIMRSNYGNYVIQKAIKLSKGDNRQKLIFSAAKDINKLNLPKLIVKWKSILSPYVKELSKEQIDYLKEQNFF